MSEIWGLLCAFDYNILLEELKSVHVSPALSTQLLSIMAWGCATMVVPMIVFPVIGIVVGVLLAWLDPDARSRRFAFGNTIYKLAKLEESEWSAEFRAMVEAEYDSLQKKHTLRRGWWWFDCHAAPSWTPTKEKAE